MNMRVPFFGTRGVLKNCVFLPLCYYSDTLLDIRKPTKPGFQSLHENPLLWELSFPCFILGNILMCMSQRLYSSTLLYCTKFVVLPFTSLSETGVFVYIRI